jgi:branched-chain amino acid aminotransferase
MFYDEGMTEIPLFDDQESAVQFLKNIVPSRQGFRAFYSSWLGGIVQNPCWMLVPVDDHMVHRGDGIFEAFRIIDGGIYLMKEHLDRLGRSAHAIGLELPQSRPEIEETILQTARAARAAKTSADPNQAMIRMYVSRGPGNFGVNPYDTMGAQLYIAITDFAAMPSEKYERGVRIGWSRWPAKHPWMATVKSCNYLPNALMKREAVDRKLDFMIGLDDQGWVGEGPTENLALITADGELACPSFDKVLRGTTLVRTLSLAQDLVATGELRGLREMDLKKEDLLRAREIFMVGTTLDILPVTELEGKPVGNGRVGPVARELGKRLRADQRAFSLRI